MTILLSKPSSPESDKTRKWLIRNKIQFTEYDVTSSTLPHNLATNLGFTQLPVIMSDNGNWQGHKVNLLKTLISV